MRYAPIILADVGAVDEAERRLEVLADLLQHEIAAPRLVRKTDSKRGGTVIALLAGKTAVVKDIGRENLGAEKIGIHILKIRARDGVFASAGRVAIGENDP